jgi:2-polyprenyl-3-methyl-5-hydroxy-6-metoxy-1,4-benzoquinol methylase
MDMDPDDAPGQAELIADVRRRWDAKAAYWDEQMGDGNAFQRELIGPAVERLLAVRPGERVLDVACGNGVASRRLAALGARVIAIDTSVAFLELARARSRQSGDGIDYRWVDATDETGLLALGEGQFAALLCNMALMDMPYIAPLVATARRLLAPGGRLVVSIQHPAFNSNATRLCAESVTYEDGDEVVSHAVKVTNYLATPPGKGTGMLGEPEHHWYFHRPLHALFAIFFRAGFVLDGLEEPAFATRHTDDWALNWRNVPEIPPVLVARFVPRSGRSEG